MQTKRDGSSRDPEEGKAEAQAEFAIKTLVENIAKTLVDYPDAVDVRMLQSSQCVLLELRTHGNDLGKVIGRDGRIAAAIRTLLGATGMKLRKRFTLDIVSREGRGPMK
jgi:predicted RNA-binding protein YlqC (UPF0109 family)